MLNKCIIMGRLTKDPEIRTTANDTPVCSFTVAVDRRYQKSGSEKQTDFINVVAWRQTAEFVSKFFAKGKMINVVGNLQIRSYDDSEGKKRYVTEVVAEEVNFCGDNGIGDTHAPAQPDGGFTSVGLDDDFSF